MRFYYRLFAFLAVLLLLTGLVFADQPQAERTVTADPAATVSTEPDPTGETDPVGTEPVETDPVGTEPVETEPVGTDPTEPDPTGTEPQPPQPTDEHHSSYVTGMSNGSFMPNKSLSRAEMAQIFFNLGDYEDGASAFADVPENAWYARAINALAAVGILEGFEDGLYHPLSAVNRAQFVTVLSRMAGITEAEAPTSFPDVPVSFWGYQAIAVAQEQGWVNGYEDGSFQPKRDVTRAEAVTMINRFLGRIPDKAYIDACDTLRFFPDVRPGKWYYYDVMEAAVPHEAHMEKDPVSESWLSSEIVTDPITNGFYCINNNLYVAVDGELVHQEQEGTCGGIAYVCTGADGICTVSVNVLKLVNGHLVLIRDGRPLYAPGSYPTGFYIANETIYAASEGYLLHAAGTSLVQGYTVICSGPNGPCRVEAEVLVLVTGEIVFLNNTYLQSVPGTYADGFHVRGGAIYVVENGFVVNTAKSGSVSGVDYTCQGESGQCSVPGRILTAADGKRYLLDNGSVITAPGLHILSDGLYCVKSDGTILLSGTYNTLTFGSNGKYTCGNTRIDSYIESIVSSNTNSSMSQQQRLRACYNYVHNHIKYRSNNNHVPQGADCSTWAETYMVRLIDQNGYGNCYCYASEMYYIARRLGYWQAKAISGAVISATYDHGWMEITLNGTDYIFDPQLEKTRNLAAGTFFQCTYSYSESIGFKRFK